MDGSKTVQRVSVLPLAIYNFTLSDTQTDRPRDRPRDTPRDTLRDRQTQTVRSDRVLNADSCH